MANVKSDGIAFLMRRFETHIDTGGVFARLPEKAYRAGSIRGQRDAHKIIDIPALEPINGSNPFILTPNGSKFVVKSSSKSTESPVLSSPTSPVNLSKLGFTGEMKVSDKGGTSSEQAAAGEESSKDEQGPEKTLASSLSTQTSSSSSSSEPSKDSTSTPQKSEANLPTAVENHGQVHLRSAEDGSTANDACIVANSSSTKISGSMNELDAAERKAAQGREAGKAVATRFIFKQASKENQNATVYLDDPSSSSSSSPSASNKVKQLARSMDNLCGNSAASTPTKERSIVHVDKSTRVVGKCSDSSPSSTAPAAIPSLANDEKAAAAARAKKPPPVPKKNPKFGREAEGRELNSKPQTGESQTMPNLSSQVKKPAARPTTLFPDHQGADNDGGGGDENDDDGRHKSLPILASAKDDGQDEQHQQHQLLPTNAAPKNTLFPCNRQKTRTRILSTETDSTAGDPDGLPYSPFVTSPMSLGARTPPDIDSLVDNKTGFPDKKYSSEQQQSITEGSAVTRTRSTDDEFDSHEAFDPDSFLSDAFDFLGSSNSAESETIKMSPLKSWTDTWCKASQKRLSKAAAASGKSAEVAGSSMEHRPTEGYRKEPTGILPDKTKQQDERTAKTKSTNVLNVGVSKTSNAPMKSSGRDEKTKTGEDAAEPPTHFGVVLRRTDAPTSLFRRSSIASLVSKEGPSAPKKANARHESFVSRPVTIGKSTDSFRTSVNLNRKPSMVSAGTSVLPLSAAGPSQKPTQKSLLFGRNIASRASSTLNRTSVADSSSAADGVGARGPRQSTSANKLESEWNDIDRAFMFLDDSS